MGKTIVWYVYCLFLITIKNFVGLVDIGVGQVNFALALARRQVLKKTICQPLLIVYCFDQNYANNMLHTVKFSPKEGNIYRVSRSMYLRFYLKFRYIICLCQTLFISVLVDRHRNWVEGGLWLMLNPAHPIFPALP